MKRLKSKKYSSVKSPCVSICEYFSDTDICRGCGRSASEITEWYIADDTRRLEILENAKNRLL
jgi:predicted Fe-S protein YdhL (DUF1289 family)